MFYKTPAISLFFFLKMQGICYAHNANTAMSVPAHIANAKGLNAFLMSMITLCALLAVNTSG